MVKSLLEDTVRGGNTRIFNEKEEEQGTDTSGLHSDHDTVQEIIQNIRFDISHEVTCERKGEPEKNNRSLKIKVGNVASDSDTFTKSRVLKRSFKFDIDKLFITPVRFKQERIEQSKLVKEKRPDTRIK
jgi:hypothetical protein